MKFRNLVIVAAAVVCLLAIPGRAQKPAAPPPSTPATAASEHSHYVPLTQSQRDAVDLASTKMQNALLRYQQLQQQFEQAKNQLQAEYKAQMDTLTSLLAADRKALGLSPTVIFTGTAADPKQPDRPAFAFDTTPHTTAAKRK